MCDCMKSFCQIVFGMNSDIWRFILPAVSSCPDCVVVGDRPLPANNIGTKAWLQIVVEPLNPLLSLWVLYLAPCFRDSNREVAVESQMMKTASSFYPHTLLANMYSTLQLTKRANNVKRSMDFINGIHRVGEKGDYKSPRPVPPHHYRWR